MPNLHYWFTQPIVNEQKQYILKQTHFFVQNLLVKEKAYQLWKVVLTAMFVDQYKTCYKTNMLLVL